MTSSKTPLGLTTIEATARLRELGPNELEQTARRSLNSILARQFASPLIYLLLLALGLDVFIWLSDSQRGWPFEPMAIAGILIVNAALGALQEYKAEAALDRLRDLASPTALVYRDGHLVRLLAKDIVEGDVVKIEAGGRIPADGLIEEGRGRADESILTGESMPVDKVVGEEVCAGSLLVSGTAQVRISRTGARSALGQIATLLAQIPVESTPLEKKLAQFGNTAARWIVTIAAILIVGGFLVQGTASAMHTIVFAVALAVAAVPEGLPAMLTVCLATGVEQMAKRNTVVRRLSAVEALGSVTVIATDKTGTLTENKIRVISIDAPDPAEAFRIMVIANEFEPESVVGDPIDRALLEYAAGQGMDVDGCRKDLATHDTRSFDSARKTMRVTVKEEGRLVSYLKGAPEILLGQCHLSEAQRNMWRERLERAASEGQRVLGLATRDEGEKQLKFAGLVFLADSPRPEAAGAVAAALKAGIRVVMVTGDHPETARAIARTVGIPSAGVATHEDFADPNAFVVKPGVNIYARVTPEDKLRLVTALQAQREIVAMTGDGVNDAPALKKSHLAIAMGRRGSDVAREVADIILLDDNFATIVAAIEEGRGIYENIRKFIRFLFSTDVALVFLVFAAAIGSFVQNLRNPDGALLLPLTPLMLLWINIISDGAPAVALGLDRNAGMLDLPPRDPSEPLLDRASMRFILISGFFKAVTGLGLLLLVPFMSGSRELARTVLFHYESLAQLSFAYPSRGPRTVSKPNRILAASIAACVALQVLLEVLPGARRVFDLKPLSLGGLTVVLVSVALAGGFAEFVMRRCLRSPTAERRQ